MKILKSLQISIIAILFANYCYAQVADSPGVAGPSTSVDGNISLFNGINGSVLKDSGTAIAGQASATLGVLNRHPGYVSLNYYPAFYEPQTLTATIPVASTVYCSSFPIAESGTSLRALAVQVTTNDVGKFVAAAIYYNGSNGRPAGLIAVTPTLTLAGTGALGAALTGQPFAVTTGVYWACVTTSSAATAQFQGPSATNPLMASIFGNSTAAPTLQVGAPTVAISCTAASTCGGTFAAWSGSTFTWSSLTSATWSLVTTAVAPAAAWESN